eukprot:ctg_352.g230
MAPERLGSDWPPRGGSKAFRLLCPPRLPHGRCPAERAVVPTVDLSFQPFSIRIALWPRPPLHLARSCTWSGLWPSRPPRAHDRDASTGNARHDPGGARHGIRPGIARLSGHRTLCAAREASSVASSGARCRPPLPCAPARGGRPRRLPSRLHQRFAGDDRHQRARCWSWLDGDAPPAGDPPERPVSDGHHGVCSARSGGRRLVVVRRRRRRVLYGGASRRQFGKLFGRRQCAASSGAVSPSSVAGRADR